MKTLRIKLNNPEQRFWNPAAADFITGDGVVEVPDVPFWRRRIADDTFELVEATSSTGERAAEAFDGKQTSSKSKRKSRKSEANVEQTTDEARTDEGTDAGTIFGQGE